MAIRQKTVIGMTMSGTGETHARTKINVRDVSLVIDEPVERGGTNLGPAPTETLMAALMSCTNVITQRIAERMGVTIGSLEIGLTSDFDRRGVLLAEEVESPFSNVVLNIDISTDATPDQITDIQRDLQMYCPIAKVFRGSGISVAEYWTVSPL